MWFLICIYSKILPFQINGHLDYMRHMETILVAVGVPTRERAGDMICQSYPRNTAEEGFAECQSDKEDGDTRKEEVRSAEEGDGLVLDGKVRPTLNSVSVSNLEKACKGSQGEPDKGEKEDTDGWDFPDISDLLDSLNEADVSIPQCSLDKVSKSPTQRADGGDSLVTLRHHYEEEAETSDFSPEFVHLPKDSDHTYRD